MNEGIRLISEKPKPKEVVEKKKRESTMTQKDVAVSKALPSKAGRNKPKDEENQLDDKTSFALTLLLFITALLVLGAGYYHYCVK